MTAYQQDVVMLGQYAFPPPCVHHIIILLLVE